MSNILVVEDDQILREVYETVLHAGGHQTDTAEDGRVALDKCKNATYDVILLDLMMPELDGVGFLKEAHLATASPATKVIIFSNLSSGHEIQEALDLGASEHILKATLTPKGLLQTIDERMNA